MMNVDFMENSFFALVKQKSIVGLEFVGSFGGLMGLVAGMSLLSIVEVISKALIVIIGKLNQHKTRNKVWVFNSAEPTLVENNFNKNVAARKLPPFLLRFLDASSIHGLQNIGDRKGSIYEKVAWAVVVSASIAFCSQFSMPQNAQN